MDILVEFGIKPVDLPDLPPAVTTFSKKESMDDSFIYEALQKYKLSDQIAH
jgi:hypothetical protein